jgi:hypothetical protein
MVNFEQVKHELESLTKLGLVRKITEGGKELFYLSFTDRANELVENGCDAQAAYFRALRECAPSLDTGDIVQILAQLGQRSPIVAKARSNRAMLNWERRGGI